MSDHHEYSPSKLKSLKNCCHFVSSKQSKYADQGTNKHDELLKNISKPIYQGDDEDINWAISEIKNIIAMNGYNYIIAPKVVDKKVIIEDTELNIISEGTPDLTVLNLLFEVKSFLDGDFKDQTYAYALGLMQEKGYETITCYEIILMERKNHEYVITREDAEKRVFETIALIKENQKNGVGPAIGEQCKYCDKKIQCEEVDEGINHALSYDTSLDLSTKNNGILDKKRIGELLDLSKVLAKWIEAVEQLAKEEAALGNVPDGYEYKETKGVRVINDLGKLYTMSGLSNVDFLSCCKVSITELLKKMPTTKKEAQKTIDVCSTTSGPQYRLTRISKRE